jgi:hypothetical protein
MRIRFDATVDELIEVQERVLERSKVARSWQRQGAIFSAFQNGFYVGTLTFIIVYMVSTLLPALILSIGLFVITSIASWYFHHEIVRQRLYKYFREQFGDRETIPFELELREAGIWTNQLGVQSMVEWANIEEINLTEETIEFYMRGGGVTFVRKRAFSSTEEHQRFIDAARQYLTTSRTSSNWLRDS